jgi:hypothetical protein
LRIVNLPFSEASGSQQNAPDGAICQPFLKTMERIAEINFYFDLEALRAHASSQLSLFDAYRYLKIAASL